MNKMAPLLLFILACSSLQAISAETPAAPQRPLIGIDHIPLAVKNVEQAADDYQRLGFALKPGRAHPNSIHTVNIKFPDGAGLELITASQPADALSARYLELLGQGEGPAYFSLHARDLERLLSTLAAAGFDYSKQDGVYTLADPRFEFLFFGRDNRSPTDRPEHFAHRNSALAMTAVWLAVSDAAPFARLLTTLGAIETQQTVFVPKPVSAKVFAVENGKVVLLPEKYQLLPGRPIVGASFQVADLDSVRRVLRSANVSPTVAAGAAKRGVFVSPKAAHGIWLHFDSAPGASP